jgi:hypothetical protein
MMMELRSLQNMGIQRHQNRSKQKMNRPNRLFCPATAVLAALLAACSNSGDQATGGALAAPQAFSPQVHVKKLGNSGVSIQLTNATKTPFTTQWWVDDNCGQSPFTPTGGSIASGQTIPLTQTANDCFVPPSTTSIWIGPTRLQEDCQFSITGSATGGGAGFTFSVAFQGNETHCSVSTTYGLSSTFSWANIP